jgi:hypothetical protein
MVMENNIKQVEYLEICKSLEETEHLSDSPEEYEKAIRDGFRFLGFSAELISGSGNTDVLLNANIGIEAFKINLDGKTSKSERISDSQINWISLQDHKIKTGADYVVVVGPDFAGGNVLKRANDFNICLLKTKELIRIIQSHAKFPFTVIELRDLFSDSGLRSLQIDDLIFQNKARKNLLTNFVIIINEMQALQDRLGYFTFESLAGREKIEDLEIELSDVKETIELLKLPFLNAIHEVSNSQYILVSNQSNLSNIFIQLSTALLSKTAIDEEEALNLIPGKASTEISITDKEKSGTKYYQWEHREQSIAAYARRERPYVHHCPLEHFKVIFSSIVSRLSDNPLINVSTIFKDLETNGFSPDRPFKGRAEDYKIRMILGILEIENLLKWTGSKSPIEYSANKSIDEFSKWFSENIESND